MLLHETYQRYQTCPYRNFTRLSGSFIALRELSVNDAKHITNSMNYNIAKICMMYPIHI